MNIPNNIPRAELEGEQYVAIVDLAEHIPKSTIYSHLRSLGEQPRKISAKAYLTVSQVGRLFALIGHLSDGGNLKSFLTSETSAITPAAPTDLVAPEVEPEGEDWTERLDSLDKLDHAAQKGYLLPTAMVAHLLGVAPGTVAKHGASFRAYGFTLERSGETWRGSSLYRVHGPER